MSHLLSSPDTSARGLPGTPRPAARSAMVVDDDPTVASVVERVLLRMAVEVIRVPQAFGVMNRIAMHRPSLVLLDVKMPGLDGPTLVTLIRKDAEISRTRLVLYSALDVDVLADTANACGADGFIAKTLGPLHLEKSLELYLGR
ncbi:response regulator [Sorangium sp. So ce131]|uniref:response regulator n=1 Tax=Sorangium sp. So ce131 TaxID=3133282 RepID=UPI003F5FE95A